MLQCYEEVLDKETLCHLFCSYDYGGSDHMFRTAKVNVWVKGFSAQIGRGDDLDIHIFSMQMMLGFQ